MSTRLLIGNSAMREPEFVEMLVGNTLHFSVNDKHVPCMDPDMAKGLTAQAFFVQLNLLPLTSAFVISSPPP